MKAIVTVNKFLKLRVKNNPFLFFILILLLITSLLKVLFYYYNYSVIFDGDRTDGFKIAEWSLTYDLLTILIINVPFLFLLILSKKIPGRIASSIIRIIFCILNTLMLVLNTIDIFYFRFHFQRANLDLLYVIDHPFEKLADINILYILGFLLLLVGIIIMIWKLQNLFYSSLMEKNGYKMIFIIAAVIVMVLIIFNFHLTRKLVPNYPLVDLNTKELNVVENSMHTFLYSLYRNNHSLLNKKYFSPSFCDSALPIKKTFSTGNNTSPKNIVLFIMESIPESFFDSSDKFKVKMPFFDSLLHHSIFFSNAYSYGRESNKGITSILAGIPTITNIPLYHSSFINLPKTSVGKALKSKSYSSFFCIGDTYDNFGFAKCVYWLGFDKYYYDKDIPDYKKLPYGPMGIYDEYVLHFMHQKVKTLQEPFLAVNYNTTTHYDYTLPPDYKVKSPKNYSNAMKSMQYYDSCLHQFFDVSKNEKWFRNTVFIFCADHWQSPDDFLIPVNSLDEFRIPIIIYDPSENAEIKDSSLVSQFDVLGTMLDVAGYSDTAISYGVDLLNQDKKSGNQEVFNRIDNNLYQVVDSLYVLGFNVANNKTEYLYNYKTDKNLENNLNNSPYYSVIKSELSDKIKVFYQKAILQYFNKPFK